MYVFAKLTNPKGQKTLEHPQNGQYLIAILILSVSLSLLDNINTP